MPDRKEGVAPGPPLFGIDFSDRALSPGTESLLNACYDATDYPNVPACSTFTRDADGQIIDF